MSKSSLAKMKMRKRISQIGDSLGVIIPPWYFRGHEMYGKKVVAFEMTITVENITLIPIMEEEK